VLAREQCYLVARTRPKKAAFSQYLETTSPWMNRTKWPITYSHARRDLLLALTRVPNRHSLAADYFLGQDLSQDNKDLASPSQDEQKISCLMGTVDVMLDRCEVTVRHTSQALLRLLQGSWLRAHKHPFSLPARDSTKKKYRQHWKRLLAFTFRVYRMPIAIRQQHTGIELCHKFQDVVQEIWEHEAWQHFDQSYGQWPTRVQSRRSLSYYQSDRGEGTDQEGSSTSNCSLNTDWYKPLRR
jgi:hypothetical protein